MTLTEFLLARIAEDRSVWTSSRHGYADMSARVLAECESKGRIVEAHPLVTDSDRLVPVWTGPTPGVACETCGGNPVDSSAPLEDIGPCETLLALALPYADHPDFSEEWRR